jgi:hypothetical protein
MVSGRAVSWREIHAPQQPGSNTRLRPWLGCRAVEFEGASASTPAGSFSSQRSYRQRETTRWLPILCFLRQQDSAHSHTQFLRPRHQQAAMRPSTSSLLRIRPIPAAQLDVHTVRLPASQRPRRTAKPSASSASTSATSSSSSSSPASSPAQTRAPLQKRAEQTIAEQLLKKEEQSRAAAAAAAAVGSVQGAGAESWPSNLRVVKHVNKRDVYWKVSRRDRRRESRPRRRSPGPVELTRFHRPFLPFRYRLLNETS